MTDGYDLLLYDDGLTDDDPQLAVIMSSSWWAYVRGAFERLLSVNAWDTASEVEAAVSQAADVMARLIGVPVSQVIAYPANVWLDFLALERETASGWTRSIDSLQMGNVRYYQTTPVLNEDILSFALPWATGHCKLSFYGSKYSNGGKFRWVVDGVPLGAGGDFDLYSAAAVYNFEHAVYLMFDGAGPHTFLLENIGKNSSSSSYYCLCSAIGLKSTIY